MHTALREAGIADVTNTGHWLRTSGSRLRIAGIGDLWEGKQDLGRALDGATSEDTAILLSHNPDYAMCMMDSRVSLMLSGHTHGGQIRLPRIGAVVTNSAYGQRLVSGLISFDTFDLYVSRGIGTVVVPLRHRCPPEVALFTLRRKQG